MRLYKHIIIINKTRTFYIEKFMCCEKSDSSCSVIEQINSSKEWRPLCHSCQQKTVGILQGFSRASFLRVCMGSWKYFVLAKSGFMVLGAQIYFVGFSLVSCSRGFLVKTYKHNCKLETQTANMSYNLKIMKYSLYNMNCIL